MVRRRVSGCMVRLLRSRGFAPIGIGQSLIDRHHRRAQRQIVAAEVWRRRAQVTAIVVIVVVVIIVVIIFIIIASTIAGLGVGAALGSSSSGRGRVHLCEHLMQRWRAARDGRESLLVGRLVGR